MYSRLPNTAAGRAPLGMLVVAALLACCPCLGAAQSTDLTWVGGATYSEEGLTSVPRAGQTRAPAGQAARPARASARIPSPRVGPPLFPGPGPLRYKRGGVHSARYRDQVAIKHVDCLLVGQQHRSTGERARAHTHYCNTPTWPCRSPLPICAPSPVSAPGMRRPPHHAQAGRAPRRAITGSPGTQSLISRARLRLLCEGPVPRCTCAAGSAPLVHGAWQAAAAPLFSLTRGARISTPGRVQAGQWKPGHPQLGQCNGTIFCSQCRIR